MIDKIIKIVNSPPIRIRELQSALNNIPEWEFDRELCKIIKPYRRYLKTKGGKYAM